MTRDEQLPNIDRQADGRNGQTDRSWHRSMPLHFRAE